MCFMTKYHDLKDQSMNKTCPKCLLFLISFSLVSQAFSKRVFLKNLPAMWETWVQSLGWEDPLEKGKAAHSSILAWRIQVHGVAKSRTRLGDFHIKHKHIIRQAHLSSTASLCCRCCSHLHFTDEETKA